MIIKRHLYTLTVAAAAAFITAGCGQPATTNTNSSTNSNAVLATNANAAAANANAASTASTSQSSDPAESPSGAYRAAYTARQKKDIAGLRKLLSKDAQDLLTKMGQMDPDKKQTLDDLLKELCEDPQAATAETRNEKIEGDKATVEYLDVKGGWEKMDFIKEDGIWKLTIEKPAGGPDAPSAPAKK